MFFDENYWYNDINDNYWNIFLISNIFSNNTWSDASLMNLTEIKHIGKTGIKRIKYKSSCEERMWTTTTMTQDLVWNLRTLKFLPLLNIQKKKTYLCKMFECWVVKNFYAKQNLVCITNIQFMVDFKQHMIQTHHGYIALL